MKFVSIILLEHGELDIESLLTKHITSLLKTESKVKRFIYNHNDWIGFACASMFFLTTLFGAYITVDKFVASQLKYAKSILTPEIGVAEKVEYLIQSTITGAWPRFQYALLLFVFISLVVAIFLGPWVRSSAENRPRSFLLLSKRAKEAMEDYLECRKQKWLVFTISIIVSITAGVISNIIFSALFNR